MLAMINNELSLFINEIVSNLKLLDDTKAYATKLESELKREKNNFYSELVSIHKDKKVVELEKNIICNELAFVYKKLSDTSDKKKFQKEEFLDKIANLEQSKLEVEKDYISKLNENKEKHKLEKNNLCNELASVNKHLSYPIDKNF